jgi:hypothetical protein
LQTGQQHTGLAAATVTLLITPNEGLSEQHETEMRQSGIEVGRLVLDNNDMFTSQNGHLTRIDFIEITKLGDKDGPTSISTRNLGDQNLILVDEGHRGMGKSEEDGWYKQRTMLTEKGFAFEYSAIFGFPHQTVRLIHDSIRREAFGTGAAYALQELAHCATGFYTFDDLLLANIRKQLLADTPAAILAVP